MSITVKANRAIQRHTKEPPLRSSLRAATGGVTTVNMKFRSISPSALGRFRPMADVLCGCNAAAEQALSGHLEVVPSLESLKQNGFRIIEDSITLTARSWFHILAIGNGPNYM